MSEVNPFEESSHCEHCSTPFRWGDGFYQFCSPQCAAYNGYNANDGLNNEERGHTKERNGIPTKVILTSLGTLYAIFEIIIPLLKRYAESP